MEVSDLATIETPICPRLYQIKHVVDISILVPKQPQNHHFLDYIFAPSLCLPIHLLRCVFGLLAVKLSVHMIQVIKSKVPQRLQQACRPVVKTGSNHKLITLRKKCSSLT